jgi:signal transduction histidine kinase
MARDGIGFLDNEALAHLAAALAHDVKNPLNTMALHLALLGAKLDETGSDACRQHLEALGEQIGRVNAIVRRFVEVLNPPMTEGKVDLNALAGNAATLLAAEARRRKVELSCEADTAPVPVAAAPGEVVQLGSAVLGTLFEGLRGARQGGRVEVAVEPEGGDGVLRVGSSVLRWAREGKA